MQNHSFLFVILASACFPCMAAAQLLQYDVTDSKGRDIPSKLTFLAPDGTVPAGLDVKSRVPEFAARKNVVYQLYGKGEIPLPAGDYRLYVSRGMEWSAVVLDLRVTRERPAVARVVLERVVDTSGYISGDFHLHTKTFSGHGDANVEERLITLCAENLEWAVSTDHNHVTDYRPYARRLGADRWLMTSVGNEVTTTAIGHLNTFPLDPREPPVNHRITDARQLFKKIRQGPLDEIIQINHPRWTGINGAYFRELDLSTTGGDPQSRAFSYDFDSLEILNDNSLAGWELRPLPNKGELEFDHSVREDWFNLLNRGFAHTGVGNSDSHEVDTTIAGCPRNFVLSSSDDPSRADERELVRAVRERKVTVSSGIFVTMSANGGRPVGSTVTTRAGEVALEIAVQAAPWIDADKLVVVGNGEPVFSADLPASGPSGASSRPVLRFHDTVRLRPKVDTWYVAYAVGDEPPYPMLHKVTIPLGFTNPIWVDVNADGRFDCLRELAARAVEPAAGSSRLLPGEITARLGSATPAFKRQAVAVLSARRSRAEEEPLSELVRDPDPGVRQAAAMALSSMDDRRAILALLLGRERAQDSWERFVFDRELVKAGDHSALEDIRTIYGGAKDLQLYQMRRDLKELCRKNRIHRWWVIGPFPSRKVEEGLATRFPPEREIDYARRYEVGPKKSARWKRASTDSSQYLNLRPAFNPDENAVAYAHLAVKARRPLETCLLLGSKCGLEVILNGSSIYSQVSAASSSAASRMVPARFQPGSNSLLVKAAVEKGDWGFNLMLVDPAGDLQPLAEPSTAPPAQKF
jgi:hypothetical protein